MKHSYELKNADEAVFSLTFELTLGQFKVLSKCLREARSKPVSSKVENYVISAIDDLQKNAEERYAYDRES